MGCRSKQTPSSAFKKALKKINSARSNSQKCKLLRNSSDHFLRDMALFTHKCLPEIKPLLTQPAIRQLKRFSSPNTISKIRRKMIEQKGGGFLNFIKNVALTAFHQLMKNF